jgi:hypothetical protein
MNTVLNEKSAKVKNAKKAKNNATQTHLRIAEIKNDVVILKNGATRAVLQTNSVNFNLKSEDEQMAIIKAYQSFLNTLDFPVQIVVQSKKLDLDNYLSDLTKVAEQQKNPLLQKQTYDYIEYIKRLLEYADIMSKSFYVVIPYNGAAGDDKAKGFLSFFNKFLQRLGLRDNDSKFTQRKKQFEHLKKGLDNRVNTIAAGLENCDLKVKRLNTQELIELYYGAYNPEIARLQKLTDVTEFMTS